MSTVNSPVATFSGKVIGETFANGSATVTDAWKLIWFAEKGYGIDAPAVADPVEGYASDQFGTTGHNHAGTAKNGPQITAGGIASGAVVVAKLAANAVETAKIKDANVTVAKLDTPLQALVLGVAGGYKIARGVSAVTGTLVVVTGLATVVAVAAVLAEDASANAILVTSVIPTQTGTDLGKFTAKVWKPTAAGDTTPIAAVLAKNVSWIAIGT